MLKLNIAEDNKRLPRVARGFTLLELLVVISIIAILAGMVMPTFYYAKRRAREAKARVTVKQLETAFKAYLDMYKVWPAEFVDGPINGNMFKIMRGENVNGANSQLIAFYEFESVTNSAMDQTTAYDTWSNPSADSSTWQPYQVMFDKDYDNKITLPAAVGGGEVYRCVVVWSVGDPAESNIVASWK